MSDDTTSPQNVEAPEVQPDRAASANREANLDAILDVPVTLLLQLRHNPSSIVSVLLHSRASIEVNFKSSLESDRLSTVRASGSTLNVIGGESLQQIKPGMRSRIWCHKVHCEIMYHEIGDWKEL